MKRLFALLLAVIMVLSMAACGNKVDTATPDEPTETTPAPSGETDVAGAPLETEPTDPTEPTDYIPEVGDGVYVKTSYTVSGEEVANNRDTVVATLADRELTVGQLQVYYWMSVYGFLNEYGAYASYFGLDLSRSLDVQKCPEGEGTWQQYFLASAVDTWRSYQGLVLQSEAENSPMDPELQAELDSLEENLKAAAEEGKYASIEEMLAADIGPGVTYEDYLAYLTVYSTGYSHYMYKCDGIEVTDDMIDAYFEENKDALAESGVTKEEGKVVDVRHILVAIEGGTKDEEGKTTYTDEEWATCEKDAQAILDQWLDGGATEESFAQLAGICTDDPGSKETGGLYENVKTGDMVEEFDAWCFDANRKVGDYGLVKTSYGYHVMYYSGDEANWIFQCRNAVMDEKITEFVNAAADANELVVDYEKAVLGHMDLAG